MKTVTLKISFDGSGDNRLSARLDLPADESVKAYAIMCHCFTCTKETLTAFRVSRGLAARHYGVLRMDFTGLGDSEGEFADSNFTTMVADVDAAINYMKDEYEPPVALIGHSLGGTAALLASLNSAACKTVITIASPDHPAHVLNHFGKTRADLEAGRDSNINVAGIDYPVKPQFVADVTQYDMDTKLSGFDKPMMAITATNDELIKPEDAASIVRYTSGSSCIKVIDGANHLFSQKEHTELVIEEIYRWLEEMTIAE